MSMENIEDKNILDYGSGPGVIASVLKSMGAESYVFDINQEVLDTCEEKLGSEKVAKCVNCHGSHELLAPSEPASMLSADNILKTCQECHEKANKNFTEYLPHANHHDSEK